MIRTRAFDPHAAPPADWAMLHAFRRARAAEDTPGEPCLADAEVERDARTPWPLFDNRRIVASTGEAIVGSLGLGIRRAGSPGAEAHARFVSAWGGVLTPWRRQGIGRALMRHLHRFMCDQDRDIATLEAHLPQGQRFLLACGAVEKQRSVENRMDFTRVDWPAMQAWRDAAMPAGSTLRWEIHAGRVPEPRFAALRAQFDALLQSVPTGGLDQPAPRYEMAGLRAWYAEMDRRGGDHFLVLCLDGAVVAGTCEASFDPRFPDRVFQALTAVAPAYRGRGLAKGLKAAMLLLLRAHRPATRWVVTSNANANAPMLSINRRLGFVLHRQDVSYQVSRDALGQALGF